MIVKKQTAFTLVEVVISMALLLTAISLVLQGMVSSQRLTAMGNAQDDIAFDSERVLSTIGADLSVSGWDGQGGAAGNFAADRSDYYFPYVMQQVLKATDGTTDLLNGIGTQFGHARRAESMVDLNLPLGLPGDPADAHTNFDETATVDQARYISSYYARSQELHFLRIASGPWSSEPSSNNDLTERFGPGDWADQTAANRDVLGILHPSPWEETALNSGAFTLRTGMDDGTGTGKPIPYGAPIYGGELMINAGEVSLNPRWETIVAPDYTGVIPDDWREYQYAVVPTKFGVGRLVKAYKVLMANFPSAVVGNNPGEFISPITGVYGMRVQDVLSENVARIVFDTYRTNDGLEVNQIRLRIFFARQSVLDENLMLTKVVDTTFAMRTRASDSDVSEILSWIGDPVGFDY